MSDYFNDTFTESSTKLLTAHTSDSGHQWVAMFSPANTPSVYSSSGGVVADGSGPSSTRISVLSTTADVSVAASLVYDSSNIANIGLMIRSSADGSNAYVALYTPTTGFWSIIKFTGQNGSGPALVTSTSTYTYTHGDVISVVFSAMGTALTLVVNGTTVCQIPDSSYTSAGYVGLWFNPSVGAAQGIFFTSLTATDFAAVVSSGGFIGKRHRVRHRIF